MLWYGRDDRQAPIVAAIASVIHDDDDDQNTAFSSVLGK